MKIRKPTVETSLVLVPALSFSLTYPNNTPTPPLPIFPILDTTSEIEEKAHLFEILKQIPKEKLGAFAKAINTLSTGFTDHGPAINQNRYYAS